MELRDEVIDLGLRAHFCFLAFGGWWATSLTTLAVL